MFGFNIVIYNNMIGAFFRFENDSHYGCYHHLTAILECLVISMTRDVNQLIYSRVIISKATADIVSIECDEWMSAGYRVCISA